MSSLKIEGRAKTFYYVASVTSAYRRALDLYLKDPFNDNYELPDDVIAELNRTSHRHYSPGFYFGKEKALQTPSHTYVREWDFIGTVDSWEEGVAHCTQRGKFSVGDSLEILQPDGSVVTLAHELGHAYHGKQIENHRPLNTRYTMPVAETASNFNELIIMNDAIAKTSGEEQIQLIESQIQDCTQTIVDIYSRFLFEDEVIRRRKDTFLFPEDLEQIMIHAQKEAFGDGLDPNYLHPYMWCCKSHYYNAGLSYYNFPYAFGCLFSRGLYAKYLEEGEAFLPKYRELLHATTVDTVEDVAKIAGIDLTKPDFWRASLDIIAEKIDLFLQYK